MDFENLKNEVLNCTSDKFNDLALKIFRFQAENCIVYKRWMELLEIEPSQISKFENIPYLPVSFFKTHEVLSAPRKPEEIVFTSSSTTGTGSSSHIVQDPGFYIQVFKSAFQRFVGNISDIRLIAMLPSYASRPGSSLIFMVDQLIKNAAEGSGFFHSTEQAVKQLKKTCEIPTLLFGVSYAMLDLIELNTKIDFSNIRVMETGGMKGRRKELVKAELHSILCKSMGISGVESEYGMTELMSQAYASKDGQFQTPPWMRISVQDPTDPANILRTGRTGRVCVADLANIYSCAFIATDDLGKQLNSEIFEIAGRLDFSDTRGCNLMWA